MKKITLLYLILIFAISQTCFAQINEKTLLPEMLPTNPQAYQFTKSGNIPVGKYSGTLQFSIPLYTITTKGLDVPITLSYQSNGSKVLEEAGWTGLGWALGAGGSIVQNVIGTDDYGRHKRRILPDLDCMLAHQSPVAPGNVWGANSTFFLGQENWHDSMAFENCAFVQEYVNGVFDTAPDKFTFSFLNYSGEFTLDWKTGKFECLTDKNVKILSSSSDQYELPVSMVIIVPEGHRFLFELKEQTQAIDSWTYTDFEGIASPVQITHPDEKTSRVYKLTKITTNRSEVVNFNYVSTVASQNLPMISQTNTQYVQTVQSNQYLFPLNIGGATSRLVTQQNYSYLSSISFDSGIVNFITSGRTDLKESKKLDRIEVANSKNQFIKAIDFTYDYFTSNQSGTNWDPFLNSNGFSSSKTAQELTQRLKLTQLKENGANPYLFEYNSQTLPKKTSYATDYWGYYNGYNFNESFFPNIYRFNIERDNLLFLEHQKNNKSPNLQYCKAAILEKVTYPTGGYSAFEWEFNTFDNVKIPETSQGTQQSINLSTVPGSNLPVQKAIIMEGGNTILSGGAMLSTRGCTNPEAFSSCYATIRVFKKELIAVVKNNPNYNQYGLQYVLATMGLLNGTNPTIYNQYIAQEIDLRKIYSDPQEKIYSGLVYNLQEGIAVFTVTGGCGTYNGTTNSSQATLTLSYREYKTLTSESKGAGLRVKSITDGNGFLSYAQKKIYAYTAGKLMSPLVFYNRSQYGYRWEVNMLAGTGEYVVDIAFFTGFKCQLSSSSFVSPSSNAQGYHVGYNSVKEQQVSVNGQNSNNGEIIEYYHNTPVNASSTGAGSYTSIAIPATKEFPANGSLQRQEIKNSDGLLNQKTSYTYQKKINDVNWSMKVQETGNFLVEFSGIFLFYPKYLIGIYPIISQQSLLKSVTSEKFVYNNGNTKIITDTKNYSYDAYNQLSIETGSGSKGEILERRFRYPYDMATSNTTYSWMTSNNVIAPAIEESNYVNNEKIETLKSSYSRRSIGNGFETPDTYLSTGIASIKGENQTGNKLDFLMHDSKINPLEILSNGKYVCFIWAYNGVYPVAKVENIRYSDIPPNIIQEIQTASQNNNEEILLQKLATLRNSPALVKSLVTTLTYKPMVGITSVTDPKGDVFKYEYDANNRLKFVKDKSGNILKENEYNFKL